MGIIKVEWEIGKDRGDRIIIYYIWLISKFFKIFNKFWKKEQLKPPPFCLTAVNQDIRIS